MNTVDLVSFSFLLAAALEALVWTRCHYSCKWTGPSLSLYLTNETHPFLCFFLVLYSEHNGPACIASLLWCRDPEAVVLAETFVSRLPCALPSIRRIHIWVSLNSKVRTFQRGIAKSSCIKIQNIDTDSSISTYNLLVRSTCLRKGAYESCGSMDSPTWKLTCWLTLRPQGTYSDLPLARESKSRSSTRQSVLSLLLSWHSRSHAEGLHLVPVLNQFNEIACHVNGLHSYFLAWQDRDALLSPPTSWTSIKST